MLFLSNAIARFVETLKANTRLFNTFWRYTCMIPQLSGRIESLEKES